MTRSNGNCTKCVFFSGASVSVHLRNLGLSACLICFTTTPEFAGFFQEFDSHISPAAQEAASCERKRLSLDYIGNVPF